jgi:erythromycin esterase-like protein
MRAMRSASGPNSGTVAAASNWDEPMQIKTVRPALAGSYERLCHRSGDPRFFLPLRGVWPTTHCPACCSRGSNARSA